MRPSRCLVEFVNGQPPFVELAWWNPEDVAAVEYDDEYRKIPHAFRRLPMTPVAQRHRRRYSGIASNSRFKSAKTRPRFVYV